MRPSAVLALVSASIVAGLPALEAWGTSKSAPQPRAFLARIAPADRIRQALNRLTYGPRPGDVERGQKAVVEPPHLRVAGEEAEGASA